MVVGTGSLVIVSPVGQSHSSLIALPLLFSSLLSSWASPGTFTASYASANERTDGRTWNLISEFRSLPFCSVPSWQNKQRRSNGPDRLERFNSVAIINRSLSDKQLQSLQTLSLPDTPKAAVLDKGHDVCEQLESMFMFTCVIYRLFLLLKNLSAPLSLGN